MVNIARIIFLFIFVIIFTNITNGQNWFSKIIPLQTKTQELKSIIPKNSIIRETTEEAGSIIYYFKDWTVTIDFSLGRCVRGRHGKWNIDEGTITNVFYETKINEVKDWIKLSYFVRDTKKLKKQEGGYYTNYTDVKKGIDYTTLNKRVYTITYFIPTLKQWSLKCKN